MMLLVEFVALILKVKQLHEVKKIPIPLWEYSCHLYLCSQILEHSVTGLKMARRVELIALPPEVKQLPIRQLLVTKKIPTSVL